MPEYSLADVKRVFDLPPALVRKLGQVGAITPAAPRGKSKYSFRDVLILRVVSALKAAHISSAKIVAAIGQIQAVLPPGEALPPIALAASGKAVAVHESTREWEASGQITLPLPMSERAGPVARVVLSCEAAPASLAHDHYLRGHVLEETDVVAARVAYLAALDVQEDHLEARINLGRLLHLDGQLEEAERIYRQAKSSSALLSFNLAVLLDDLDRQEDAVTAYNEALAQDPSLYDAHFNLSRLHEMANRPREAFRHLLAYKRQTSRHGE